jgi:tetratricopeptide (TPR) repeat protein
MIIIPSDEEMEQWRSSHEAKNAAWRTVLRGRTSPAMIGYSCDAPGKLSDVFFTWSSEDSVAERKAIELLEQLGPDDGLHANGKSWATEYWIGVDWGAYRDFSSRVWKANYLQKHNSFQNAEDCWSDVLNFSLMLLGENFPEIADIYFQIADFYFDFEQFEKHDENFEKGLLVLEKSYLRNPVYFVKKLNRKLNEAVHVFLERKDLGGANAMVSRWEDHKASASMKIAEHFKRDLLQFARVFSNSGEISQAALIYREALAASKNSEDKRDAYEKILMEVAAFCYENDNFSGAEEAFEELLTGCFELRNDGDKFLQIAALRYYRAMLTELGRKEDLGRLNDRSLAFDVANSLRVDEKNAFGYIDTQGYWQIPRQYVAAFDFRDGVARVREGSVDDTKCSVHLIDRYGNDLGCDFNHEMCVSPPPGYTFFRKHHNSQLFQEGLACVSKVKADSPKYTGDKASQIGFADQNGKLVIEARFSDAYGFQNGFAIVATGGFIGAVGCVVDLRNALYGVIDKTGQFVIEPIFDKLRPYGDDGLYTFIRGVTAGIVNLRGEILIEDQTAEYVLMLPSDGMADFERGGKHGFIDINGRVAIEPAFDFVLYFEDGVAWVEVDNKWGLIDKSGAFLIEPTYDDVSNFEDGLACVSLNKKSGGIDKTGKVLIDFKYDRLRGLRNGIVRTELDGKQGLIRASGEVLCEPLYDEIEYFAGETAIVKNGNLKGLIHVSGKCIAPPDFVDVKHLNDGLAAVCVNSDEQLLWGFVDMSGAFAIEPQFFSVQVFSEGLAAVAKLGEDGPEFYFVDKIGTVKIAGPFDHVDQFRNGLARVGLGPNNDRRYGYINAEGHYILEPQYRSVGRFAEGLAWVGEYAGPSRITIRTDSAQSG